MARRTLALGAWLMLAQAGLQAKSWEKLRHVERAQGLYTVVEGYWLRPQKAVQFYSERGNTQAAVLANEALQLQLKSRQIWRRDMGYGALGGALIGAVLGYTLFESNRAYLLSREQNSLIGAALGLNAGFLGGMIYGAIDGASYRLEGEAKVAQAASVWILSKNF